jgi:hypothetical protein
MSFPIFAEYYFVKNTKLPQNKFVHSACHVMPIHKHHYAYKQQVVHFHHHPNFTHIYSPYDKTNYNLDTITGDDDPYVYLGMNIDR